MTFSTTRSTIFSTTCGSAPAAIRPSASSSFTVSFLAVESGWATLQLSR